jgi:ribonuclease Z
LKYRIHFVEIEEGIIFEDEQILVEARLLKHGIPSYGYRIVEKERPGILLVDKLQEAGISPGPIYKRIKSGENVTLEDGTFIDGKLFTGPSLKGRIVTILGDTRKCEASKRLAQDADLLVHEATFSEGEEALAHEYYHSTTIQAATIAKEANVKRLCLTHISSRYDRDAWKALEDEARKVFPMSEVAEDFKEIIVPLVKS